MEFGMAENIHLAARAENVLRRLQAVLLVLRGGFPGDEIQQLLRPRAFALQRFNRRRRGRGLGIRGSRRHDGRYTPQNVSPEPPLAPFSCHNPVGLHQTRN